MPVILAALIACAAAVPAASATAATRSVPTGFYGVDMDPWAMQRQGVDIPAELALAARSGVESVRIPIYWFDVQTYGSVNSVPTALKTEFTRPADGSPPFRWGRLDSFFAAAAEHSIRVLPIVLGAPRWAADTRLNRALPIPRSPSEYAAFSSALAHRYGPSGEFWQANPSLPQAPVREWQIWNEPDIEAFWPQHAGEAQSVSIGGVQHKSTAFRFAPTYLELLRAARTAIKGVDPGSTVLLGSLTNSAWKSLQLIYSAGGHGLFDGVAANIFSKSPKNIPVAIKRIRSVMSAHGDSRLPYTVTEYSWAAPKGVLAPTLHMSWLATSQTTQARNAAAAMRSFKAARQQLRVNSTYWYTWASTASGAASVWDYAGMRVGPASQLQSRPVLASFAQLALAAEGCRSKLDSGACIA